MAGFYEIYLKPSKAHALTFQKAVERKLNLALDWYRVDANIWVICTTKNARIWYSRLQRLVKTSGYMFIARLDINDRQGWMPKKFWEWVKKNQSRREVR